MSKWQVTVEFSGTKTYEVCAETEEEAEERAISEAESGYDVNVTEDYSEMEAVSIQEVET